MWVGRDEGEQPGDECLVIRSGGRPALGLQQLQRSRPTLHLPGCVFPHLTYACPTLLSLPHFYKASVLPLSHSDCHLGKGQKEQLEVVHRRGPPFRGGASCHIHMPCVPTEDQPGWLCEQADPRLAYSTGFDFAPQPEEHEWTFSVEPVTGFTTTVRLPSLLLPAQLPPCCSIL
jgi:hypothetical protein